MAKNEVQLTLKLLADVKEAEAAAKQLGKTLQDNITVKNNKSNGLLKSIEDIQSRLSGLTRSLEQPLTSSKSAKSSLKDFQAVSRELENIGSLLNQARQSPEKFFTSSIATGCEKAAAGLDKVNENMRESERIQKRIQNLSANGKNFSKTMSLSDIAASNKGDINKTAKRLTSMQNNNTKISQSMFKNVINDINDEELKAQFNARVKTMKADLTAAGDNDSEKQKIVAATFRDLNSILEKSAQSVAVLKDELKQLNANNIETINNAVAKLKEGFEKANISDEGLLDGLKTAKTQEDVSALAEQIRAAIANSAPQIQKDVENQLQVVEKEFQESYTTITQMTNSAVPEVQNAYNALADTERAQRSIKTLTSRIEYFFSLQSGFRLMTRAIRSAFSTVKDLDSVMTETAVVTENTVGDMWDKLDQFTEKANELGATTQGAYETMTLYYQQGLNDQQAWELGAETMKMARIAGMDYADATDAMTAAIRGFNNELSLTEQSAQKVNDVYSELAAKTASNTEEIATAMSKVASLASNAGMDLNTTAVYLAQAIETTREAPENIGTAMKTVLARFTSLTKDPSELTTEETEALDGETVDANAIETALKTAGVQLRDTNGQFRAAKDVMLELNAAWDGLDKNTQRYIATQTAGSRQQSRFIAMMSDYSHTMELMGYAENSAGASQEQFDKTLESLEAKLNRLSNAWNEYMMGLANSKVIKGVVDLLTDMLTAINKITGKSGSFLSMIAKWVVAFAGFKGLGKIVSKFFNLFGVGFDFEKIGAKGAASLIGGFITRLKKGNLSNVLTQILSNPFKGLKDAFQQGGILSDLQTEDISFLKNKGIGTSNAADLAFIESYTAARNQGAMAEEAYTIACQARAQAQAEAAAVEEGATLVADEHTGALVLETEVEHDQLQATVREALGIEADTIAKEADTGATIGLTGATKGLSAAFSRLWTTLAPILPLLLAVAAIYTYWKKFDTGQQLQRVDDSINSLNSDMESTEQAISDITNNWEDLTSSNLDGLQKGTWEWQKALLAANKQVSDLLEQYPELINFVTTDSNGEMLISEEGLNYLSNTLKEKAQKEAEANLIAQAQKAKLSEMSYGTGDALSPKSMQNSSGADVEAARAEYKAQQEASLNNALKQIAQRLQNPQTEEDSQQADKIGEAVAMAIDKNSIKYEDDAFNTKTEAQLRQEYKDMFGSTASSELTKDDLVSILAAAKTQENYEAKVSQDLPLFTQLANAKFTYTEGEGEDAEEKAYFEQGKITFAALDKWLAANGINENHQTLSQSQQLGEVMRYVLQQQGTYNAQTYEDAGGLRTAISKEHGWDNFSQRTEALNNMTGLNFTEEEIKEMWKNGTYQGISEGSQQAYNEATQSMAYNRLLDVVNNNSNINQLADNGFSDELNSAIKDINKFLGLEGEAALKSKTIKNNFDLVKDAINGDTKALQKLNAIDLLPDLKTITKDDFWDMEGVEKQLNAELAKIDPTIDINATLSTTSLLALADKFENVEFDANGTVILDADTQALWDKVSTALSLLSLIDPTAAEQVKGAVEKLAALNGLTLVSDEKRVAVGSVEVPDVDQSASGKFAYGYNAKTKMHTETIYATVPTFHLEKGNTDATGVPKTTSPSTASPSTDSGSGGGGGGSEDTKDPWENSLDKLYNLEKKIAKELREQTKLQREHEKLLKNSYTSLTQVRSNFQKQMAKLGQVIQNSQEYINKRYEELNQVQSENSDLNWAAWYDKKLGAVQINWDAINKITDQEAGERIEKYISKLENIQDTIEEMEDKIDDAYDARETYFEEARSDLLSLEERAVEAYIAKLQQNIDKLNTINDSINDSNTRLFNAVQKVIDEQRQTRENAKTEKDLADKQAKLAYLKQDTSGANALAIKQLEKELSEGQESYTDSLVDQRLQAMQDSADQAAEQRERQLELMQDILDWQHETGYFNDYILELIKKAEADKILDNKDELYQIIMGIEGLGKFKIGLDQLREEIVALFNNGLSTTGKTAGGISYNSGITAGNTNTNKNNMTGYNIAKGQSVAAGDSVGGGTTKEGYSKVEATITDISANSDGELRITYKSGDYTWTDTFKDAKFAFNEETGKNDLLTAKEVWTRELLEMPSTSGKTIKIYHWKNNTGEHYSIANKDKNGQVSVGEDVSIKKAKSGKYNITGKTTKKQYKTGGLADYTGPAWLDGTPSKPEIVLNAEDSANFIQLRDILSDLFKNGTATENTSSRGDNYYEISVNVDSLNSDYDVEQVAKQIKKMIVNDSNYRNVNAINRLR